MRHKYRGGFYSILLDIIRLDSEYFFDSEKPRFSGKQMSFGGAI